MFLPSTMNLLMVGVVLLLITVAADYVLLPIVSFCFFFVLVWLVQDTSCRLCLTVDGQSICRLPCFVVGVVPLFLNGSDKIAISIFK